jgi:hypothetical protein
VPPLPPPVPLLGCPPLEAPALPAVAGAPAPTAALPATLLPAVALPPVAWPALAAPPLDAAVPAPAPTGVVASGSTAQAKTNTAGAAKSTKRCWGNSVRKIVWPFSNLRRSLKFGEPPKDLNGALCPGLHARAEASPLGLHYFVVPRPNFAVLLLGASALLVSARTARAEQFVLIDATFDYTWDDALNAKPDKSHFYVNEKNFLNTQRPKNWLSPVDYRNGTLHVRTEVFKKPAGDQQVGWTLCYIANQGDYGCADTTYYKSTGVFDRETKMTDWWQNDKIEWDAGIKQVDLIYAIDDSGSGHITNYPALKDLTTPTRVRITMVQVSAGSTYDPSIIDTTTGVGGSGAGAGGMGGMGGNPLSLGGSGGASAGGYGGLLGMAGMDAAAGFVSAGTAPTTNAGASAVGAGGAASATGASGAASATGASGASSNAVTDTGFDNDSSCAFSGAPRGWAGLGGALAALFALALARRTRRLLRR